MITTERRIPLDPTVADAGETVTDGWYIDLDTRLSCERYPGAAYGYIVAVRYGSPPPIVSFKNIGEPETGHAVASTTTITFHERLPDGTTSESVSTWSLEVTEITKGPLDPALFEAPAGFLDVTPGSWGYYWKGAKQWLVGEIQRLVG